MSPSKLFLFSNETHLTVTVFVTALCFSHHACCLLYIWAKLSVAFTFTSFPFNLYTCVIGCGCGFGLEQKFWRIDGFGEKKARIGGFAYPYSTPSVRKPRMTWVSKLCKWAENIINKSTKHKVKILTLCKIYHFLLVHLCCLAAKPLSFRSLGGNCWWWCLELDTNKRNERNMVIQFSLLVSTGRRYQAGWILMCRKWSISTK